MSPEDESHDSALRLDHSLARTLSAEAQLKQCVDHLENPEILVHETIQAWRTIEKCSHQTKKTRRSPNDDQTDVLVLEHFFRDRELEIFSPEPVSFTVLASNLQPLQRPESELEFDGLDYVGRVGQEEDLIALGAVESDCDPTVYLLLLRSLSCLIELDVAMRSSRLPDELSDSLDGNTRFDLHLVLAETPERADPLLQLTRDLSESLKRGLRERDGTVFPLQDILCLRMDPRELSGQLELEWKV